MSSIHTHYDNLKVTRNAPPEVIRAAYKTLTQKYHPDRHPGNADAERVMALINQSFQVLSDPSRRAAHDRWITEQEQSTKQASQSTENSASSARPTYQQASPPKPPVSIAKTTTGLISHVLRNWVAYGILGVLTWAWALDTPKKPPVGPKPYQALPALDLSEFDSAAAKPEKVKPNKTTRTVSSGANDVVAWGAGDKKMNQITTAPNGQQWPLTAGYVKGSVQSHTNGLSTVTVDNSQNDSDVFVKLVSLDGPTARPVRQFYIPAFDRFTLKKVTAGNYDIRYRDLSSGGLSRSEAVTLGELRTNDGVQFSNMTMTLYKVKNGNMQTFGLSEAEF